MNSSDITCGGAFTPNHEGDEYAVCDMCDWDGTWGEAIEVVYETDDGAPWLDWYECPRCRATLREWQ